MPLRAMIKLVVMYQSTRSNCRARSQLGNQEEFSIVGGAAGAGTWGQVSSGTFRWVRGTSGDAVDGDWVDTPGTSEIRRECWSRGRIVSALLLAAQGGCHPSMEPPNPVAATMGRPPKTSKACSVNDTGLHGRQQGFMKGAQHPSDGLSDRELQGGPPAGCC